MLLGTMPRAGAADTGTGASQILRTTLDNGLQVVIVRNACRTRVRVNTIAKIS